MSEAPKAVKAIMEAGWRQGSVLPQDLVDRLRRDGLLRAPDPSGEMWIVISHDCDITSSRLDLEPVAEIIRLCVIPQDRINGNYEWCKNPRVFHIRQAGPTAYSASIHDRHWVPRDRFIDHSPDLGRTLERDVIERIALWLARRYTRAAFADAFNDRCQPAVAALRKEFKSKGGLLTGVYLVVEQRELPPEEDYRIVVIASMRRADYQDSQNRADAQALLGRIEAELDDCEGVSVGTAELRSEGNISLDDLRLLRRWDFDDMSLRSESPSSSLPPQP